MFLKKGDYSEIKALSTFDSILVEQYGLGRFVKGRPSKEDVDACKTGYERLSDLLKEGNHDVVIAEEANVACMCGLLSEKEVLTLMDEKPDHVELVLTGRGATPAMIARADLVTEMKAVKHYYEAGVAARVGIEK